jgi:hypothetical protein
MLIRSMCCVHVTVVFLSGVEALKRGSRDLLLRQHRMYVVDSYGHKSGHQSIAKLDRKLFHWFWQDRYGDASVPKYALCVQLPTSTPVVLAPTSQPNTGEAGRQAPRKLACKEFDWDASKAAVELQDYLSTHSIRLSNAPKVYRGKMGFTIRYSCYRGPTDESTSTIISEHHSPKLYRGRPQRIKRQRVGCKFSISLKFAPDCAPTKNPLTGED